MTWLGVPHFLRLDGESWINSTVKGQDEKVINRRDLWLFQSSTVKTSHPEVAESSFDHSSHKLSLMQSSISMQLRHLPDWKILKVTFKRFICLPARLVQWLHVHLWKQEKDDFPLRETQRGCKSTRWCSLPALMVPAWHVHGKAHERSTAGGGWSVLFHLPAWWAELIPVVGMTAHSVTHSAFWWRCSAVAHSLSPSHSLVFTDLITEQVISVPLHWLAVNWLQWSCFQGLCYFGIQPLFTQEETLEGFSLLSYWNCYKDLVFPAYFALWSNYVDGGFLYYREKQYIDILLSRFWQGPKCNTISHWESLLKNSGLPQLHWLLAAC